MWNWFKQAVVASVHEDKDASEQHPAPVDEVLELTEVITDDD